MEQTQVRTYAPKLKDVLPKEFRDTRWKDTPVGKLADQEVIAVHHHAENPWPGPHKNVDTWFVLADRSIVGVNESPDRGLTFPVSEKKIKSLESYFKDVIKQETAAAATPEAPKPAEKPTEPASPKPTGLPTPAAEKAADATKTAEPAKPKRKYKPRAKKGETKPAEAKTS